MSLEVPGSRRQVKEAGIDDVAPPEVQFTVKKKMTQKEKKAAQELRLRKLDSDDEALVHACGCGPVINTGDRSV
jgi:hypothetical protein